MVQARHRTMCSLRPLTSSAAFGNLLHKGQEQDRGREGDNKHANERPRNSASSAIVHGKRRARPPDPPTEQEACSGCRTCANPSVLRKGAVKETENVMLHHGCIE